MAFASGVILIFGLFVLLGLIGGVMAVVTAIAGGIMLMIKRNLYFDRKRKYMTFGGVSFICLGCAGFISMAACVGSAWTGTMS